MAWAKLDDGFWAHPKVMAAGLAATGLYVKALAWCSQYLTDGRIPKTSVPLLLSGESPKLCARLLEAGLWHEDGDAWVMPHYLDYNPSKDQVLAERDGARERMRNRRGSSSNVRANTSGTPAERSASVRKKFKDPVPDPPVLTEQRETRVPRDPPPSRPSAGESGSQPAGPGPIPDGALPPWSDPHTDPALSDLADDLLVHYNAEGKATADNGAWSGQSRRALRGGLLCALDHCRTERGLPLLDARDALKLALSAAARGTWRKHTNAQGKPVDLYLRPEALFGPGYGGDATAKAVDALLQRAAEWQAGGGKVTVPVKDRPISELTLDELERHRPPGWDYECLRRKPDVTTWPDAALHDTDVPGAWDELQKRIKAKRPVLRVAAVK